MWIEDISLAWLSESWNSKEVSEEEKKKAEEDSRWAARAKKQARDSQKKSRDIAIFLSKVLWRYYNNWAIINIIHWLLESIESEEWNLYIIFSPFLNLESYDFTKTNEYVSYLKSKMKKINNTHIELVLLIIESEKLWWKDFWKNLKDSKNLEKYNDFLREVKNNLI